MKYALHFIGQAFHGVNNNQELGGTFYLHLGCNAFLLFPAMKLIGEIHHKVLVTC